MFIASVPSNSPETSSIRTVVGIVPDGVDRVRINSSGANPKTIPVEANVFSLRDKSDAFPESIDFAKWKYRDQ